jgi:hypothetical protein
VARKGGRIAGEAREKLEVETGSRVSTPENYLDEPESRKRNNQIDPQGKAATIGRQGGVK